MQTYFYSDKNKKLINEDLLTEKAESWAEKFIRPKRPNKKYLRNPVLTSTQLRKFHMEAKTLEERCKNLQNPNEDFIRIRPLIKMLKSKAAYACPDNGKDRKIPEEFKNYIDELIDNIDDIHDFKAFALCFEAVVGYFYGKGGR